VFYLSSKTKILTESIKHVLCLLSSWIQKIWCLILACWKVQHQPGVLLPHFELHFTLGASLRAVIIIIDAAGPLLFLVPACLLLFEFSYSHLFQEEVFVALLNAAVADLYR